MDAQISAAGIGITALGSGSGGNAFVLHSPAANYLVDAGFSRKELCARMAARAIAPESIRAVLISHEHIDHVRGCRVFADALGIPAYVPGGTAAYLARKNLLPEKVVEFADDVPFELPGVKVSPFPVQHDALDTVGFEFRFAEHRIAIATDIGCMNLMVQKHLFDADILVLESNYDLKMLLESQRKPSLKHRIMGSSGHLDNVHAVQALADLLGPHTQALLLAHISRECNDRALVGKMFEERLAELGRKDVECALLSQDEPSRRYAFAVPFDPEHAYQPALFGAP